MENYKNNVPVMILFFTRPDVLEKVFTSIRQAKPSVLFLFQDGPINSKDQEKIDACRRIVENIDWQCDVKRFYSETNLGCAKASLPRLNGQTFKLKERRKQGLLKTDGNRLFI